MFIKFHQAKSIKQNKLFSEVARFGVELVLVVELHEPTLSVHVTALCRHLQAVEPALLVFPDPLSPQVHHAQYPCVLFELFVQNFRCRKPLARCLKVYKMFRFLKPNKKFQLS